MTLPAPSNLLRQLRSARSPRGFWPWIVHCGSGEWLLRDPERSNGGTVILRRALIITSEIYVIAFAFLNIIDPARSWDFEGETLRRDVLASGNWVGTIFAAAYVALYARFSAQWSYLADVYNQIKQVEAAGASGNRRQHARVLAQWKAGFIEDADYLHLAAKPSFASTILLWGSEPLVRRAFTSDCSGGEQRLSALIEVANRVHKKEDSRWSNT